MNAQELHVIQALEKAGATEHLTDREKHLIGLAVTITRGCGFCTGGRTEKALGDGVSQETLQATTDLVAAVNAGVAVRTMLLGMDGLKCDGPNALKKVSSFNWDLFPPLFRSCRRQVSCSHTSRHRFMK